MAAILAAAMSNLSAALNALASTTVMDFLRPTGNPQTESGDTTADPYSATQRDSTGNSVPVFRGEVALARTVTLVWGAILFGVALLARNWGNVLQTGLSIASVLYGSLLGVFLLGVATRRVGESAAIFGMAWGLAAMRFVRFETSIAFTWYVLIGTSVTFLVGLAGSFLWKEPRAMSAR
jgi:Na+/proline symporter